MRCFLGIKLDRSLVEEVEGIKKEFKKTNGDIKLVERENLHFTVKFLGEVEEGEISKVYSIEDILEGYDPFTVGLKGVGVFPSKDYIKVIWIGVDKGEEKLKKILEDIDERLEEKGFSKEDNEIVPHMTIARVKSGRNKKKIVSTLERLKGKKIGRMKIEKVTLFKSNLTPEGPVYKNLKEYNL